MKKIALIFITISLLSLFSKAQNLEWLVKPQYDVISPFYDGVAVVKRDNKWGYINEEGKEIMTPVDGIVYNFSENLGVVTSKDNTITALVDSKGKITTPERKVKIDSRFPQFSDGFLLVTDGKKWGYLNTDGKLNYCEYRYAKPFSEGLAAVALTEGWFYIDVSNRPVIRCEINKVKYWTSGFYNGKAFALYENGLDCIDKSGNKMDYNLPLLKAPKDYPAYFANTLLCSGGEIIFDAINRVISINEKSGKVNKYFELPQTTVSNVGHFTVNGVELPYISKDVYWNSQSSATISISGQKGIVVLKDKPIITIEKPDIVSSTLGNPAEFKLQALNSSQKDLNALVFKLEKINETQTEKIIIGEKKELTFSIPKETELAIENKEIWLSVLQYGLLLEKVNFTLQLKDNPALEIKFPEINTYHILQGEKVYIPIEISNISSIPASQIFIKIKRNKQEIDSEIRMLLANEKTTIGIPVLVGSSSTEKIEVLVSCPKVPLISKSENFFFIVKPIKEVDGVTNKNKKSIPNDGPKKIDGLK